MKTRITAAVLGLVMLSMTTAPCGTIAGGAIGAGTGYGAKKGALIGGGAGAAAGAVYDILH